MRYLLLFLLFSFTELLATNPTDIKTKYGTWINIQIIDSTETYFIIKTTQGNRTVYKESIIQIVYAPFNTSKESELIEMVNPIDQSNISTTSPPTLKTEYELPNLLMLPLTAALGYLSYDYFTRVSDIQTQEDEFKRLGIEIDFKNEKTRYTIGGVIFLVAAITNTIFALKSVKVTGNNSSIGLSYNF